MDISDKVSQPDKQAVNSLTIECQVLHNLLKERKGKLQDIVMRALRENTSNPDLYDIQVQGQKWALVLKPSALSLSVGSGLPLKTKRAAN